MFQKPFNNFAKFENSSELILNNRWIIAENRRGKFRSAEKRLLTPMNSQNCVMKVRILNCSMNSSLVKGSFKKTPLNSSPI